MSEIGAGYQSAKLANLQATLLHPATSNLQQTYNPHPQLSRHFFLCAHSLSFSLPSLYLSLSFSFSLAGCEDASSTLHWRQIRPSRPCHRKTSPRKVATSSPFQLICRHSKSGEEEGSPCSSITTSSKLSQGKNQGMIRTERKQGWKCD